MSWFGGDDPVQVGREVLSAYYDEAVKFPEFGYPSYEAWIEKLNSTIDPEFEKFIGDLVLMNSAATSPSMSADATRFLANQSGGTASVPQIVKAAGGDPNVVNWSAALPEIAVETTQDVVHLAQEVAQNVGQGVIGTVKLAKYLPWILGGAAALYVFVIAKGHGKLFSKNPRLRTKFKRKGQKLRHLRDLRGYYTHEWQNASALGNMKRMRSFEKHLDRLDKLIEKHGGHGPYE